MEQINSDKKTRIVQIKMSEEDYRIIKENADLHASGNVSALLRYTGKNCKVIFNEEL